MSSVIKNDEQTIFALRELYEKYGYLQYKMNKFEEYDLYVRNKNFLVSDNIITFTDADGKLMALKPDVTLSIVKKGNEAQGNLQKVYYDENVYRAPKGTQSFKEITQVGLECIGDTDDYSIFEVVSLAIKSLQSISKDFVLDISHLGIVSELINELEITGEQREQLIKCIGEKNVHDIAQIKGGEKLQKLLSTYGNLDKVLPILNEIYPNGLSNEASLLVKVVKALENEGYKNKVRIDFSVLNDMNYYSGMVFKGFVNGVPASVLTGGQYDYLMKKLGRKARAIGFAVYIDMLEQLNDEDKGNDVDTVIVYQPNTNLEIISKTVSLYSEQGKSVLATNGIPKQIKFRQLVKLNEKGETAVEINA